MISSICNNLILKSFPKFSLKRGFDEYEMSLKENRCEYVYIMTEENLIEQFFPVYIASSKHERGWEN